MTLLDDYWLIFVFITLGFLGYLNCLDTADTFFDN